MLTHLPLVVFVKFLGRTWKLPGMSEPGVYPVAPVRRQWKLDQGRSQPSLYISRQGFVVGPAFAITAHMAQGQELTCMIDLNIPECSSPITGYVALSRVKHRDSVLILRPFPLALFQKGSPEGPEALLDFHRGCLDLARLQADRCARKVCKNCLASLTRHAFSPAEWREKPGRCLGCEVLATSPTEVAKKQTTLGRLYWPRREKAGTCRQR